MTRKPSGKGAVKGMSQKSLSPVPQKEFKVMQPKGKTHGIINGGQPPKKFPVNRQGK